MFTAEKARKLTKKVQANSINWWERLQMNIRNAAFRGENCVYISNENYLKLATTLEVFGYHLNYDSKEELWRISW